MVFQRNKLKKLALPRLGDTELELLQAQMGKRMDKKPQKCQIPRRENERIGHSAAMSGQVQEFPPHLHNAALEQCAAEMGGTELELLQAQMGKRMDKKPQKCPILSPRNWTFCGDEQASAGIPSTSPQCCSRAAQWMSSHFHNAVIDWLSVV